MSTVSSAPIITEPARVSQGDVAALYDRLAGFYDLWGRLTESRARQRALELAAIRSGEDVLEIAVGTGLAFAEIVRRNPGGQNVGIDLSAGMLAEAERRLQRAGLTQYRLSTGTAEAIDEPGQAFDLILNCYLFDLLEESLWTRVLDEYRRVLRPTGRLVLVNMTAGEKPGSGFYQRLYRWSPRLMGGCRPVQLAGPLGRHGFTVQSREYIQQCLLPSEVILATRTPDTA